MEFDDIVLLWYGSSNMEMIKDFENKIVFINSPQKAFVDYIHKIGLKQKVFLILSVSCCKDILPLVHNLRQIDSIFLYSILYQERFVQDILNEYSKIIDVYLDLDKLSNSLITNIDLTQKQAYTFSFYNQHQKATRDLTKESAQFLWFQLLKDVIQQMPSNDLQSKIDLIDNLKQIYYNNSKQLKLIKEFDGKYRSSDAIRWYTGQPFLYKNLNKSLRTEDVELLYLFRYFIHDLCNNLFTEYSVIKEYEPCLNLYRGTRMSRDDFEKLKQNQGKLISINGFLSTSMSKDVAMAFIADSTMNKKCVLFEIECHLAVTNSIILAPVYQYSAHPDEEEVLIDIGAVFQIVSILENNSDNIAVVKITATDEGSRAAEEYIRLNREDLEYTNVSLLWGDLLKQMGQYDKALGYFAKLLKNTNDTEKNHFEIHSYLGDIYLEKGNYDKAYEHYYYVYDKLIKLDEPTFSYRSINGMCTVLRYRCQYVKAIEYLISYMKHLDKGDSRRCCAYASCLTNMGNCYYGLGKFQDALDSYTKAQNLLIGCYSTDHFEIGRNLVNIGNVYRETLRYDEALKCFLEASKIYEKCYPADHHVLGENYINIGNIFQQQESNEKKDEAIKFFNKALEIQLKTFPDGHYTTAQCLNNIGIAYAAKNSLNEAFQYLTRALIMYKKTVSTKHQDTAVCMENIAVVLANLEKIDEAFKYHQMALDIQENLFPTGHYETASTLFNMGVLYKTKVLDYDSALRCFFKALNIYERLYPHGHRDYDITLLAIGDCYLAKGECTLAQKYYHRVLSA